MWALIIAVSLGTYVSAATPTPFPTPTPTASQRLSQYLGDLKKNPQDQDLRKSIIKLALQMKPSPSIPGEVYELKGYADAAFKNAKTPADYNEAAQAYQKVLLLAPWVPSYYLKLCSALENAGNYNDAATSLEFYLLASPNIKNATEIHERIGALKYRADKAAAAAPPPTQPPAAQPATPPPPASARHQIKGMIEPFIKLAPAKYSKTYECRECNLEEYTSVDHWQRAENAGSHAFNFPKDGSIQLWSVRAFSRTLELVGKPKGPLLKDVVWNWCKSEQDCSQPVWVDITDDFINFTYSLQRPFDDSAFNPADRFLYTRYSQ